MKVIGAGFGRTGTLSLKAALETPGFDPCHHMAEVFKTPSHAKLWHQAALDKERGEPVNWEALLGGYEATVDWPGCYFWEELMRAYPEAKVLLSVRDPEGRYESAYRTIYQIRRGIFGVLYMLPVVKWIPKMMDLIWENTFGVDFEDREHATGVFEHHIQEVREKFPVDKLLAYEVGQGWGPLCEFLGAEVPDNPFPHLNSSVDRRWLIRGLTAFAYAAPVVVAVLVGVVLFGVLRIFRSLDEGPKEV